MAGIFDRKSKFLLLLCVLAIVTSSGCVTGTNQTTGGPGIVVEKFETSQTLIESGEPVSLQLEVRNMGDYNGEMGLGAPVIAEIMSLDPTEWMVTPSTIIDLGTLSAPDPESQTRGGLGKATWNLVSPMLDRGQRKTYEIRGRVYYQYETKAIKPIWFVTANELEAIVKAGESLAAEPTTVTAGPLSVNVRAGNFVKQTEWRNARFQLEIEIRNAGGGRIMCDKYPVAIQVEWPPWVAPVEGNCPSETLLIGTPIYDDVPPGLPVPSGTFIQVWDGQSTDLTCDFEVIDVPSSRTQGNFEIKLGYIYSVDATTQITVKGMEQF